MIAGTQLVTLTMLALLLVLHDIVPLGKWNNVRRAGLPHRLGGTMTNAAVGLALLYFACTSFSSHGLTTGRQVVISILIVVLVGAIDSWWLPWLFGTDEKRRRELSLISSNTLTLLPDRHGVNPNALHCMIHVLTVAALVETSVLARL